MTFLMVTAIKVAIVLCGALVAAAAIRRQSAATRHAVLAVTTVCVLILPAAERFAPIWTVSSIAGRGPTQSVATPTSEDGIELVARPAAAPANASQSPNALPIVARALSAIWVAGTGLSVVMLLIGVMRLRRIGTQAQPSTDAEWIKMRDELAASYGIRRAIQLLETDGSMVFTWGTWRPRVLMPELAHAWPDDRVRAVLAHELAHIRRNDWLLQMSAEVVRAAHWFNPLAWLMARQLRAESEQACDDVVLSTGIAPEEYATHLVDVARVIGSSRLPAAAVVRPSNLQRRIEAMLRTDARRNVFARSHRAGLVIVMLALVVALAGARMRGQIGSAMLSGFVFDQTNTPIPGAAITLARVGPPLSSVAFPPMNLRFTNASVENVLNFVSGTAGARVIYDPRVGNRSVTVRLNDVSVDEAFAEVARLAELSYSVSDGVVSVFPDPEKARGPARTDAAGYFEVSGLPDGRYFVQTVVAGFNSAGETMMLTSEQPVRKDVVLHVGTLEETIRVVDSDGPPAPPRTAASIRPAPPCSGSGGKIIPPRKIRDVRPIYPENLRASRWEGEVLIDATIGLDGSIREARVTRPVDPAVERSAIAAVTQWQFTPTYLNCAPVEVVMKVSVTFKPRE